MGCPSGGVPHESAAQVVVCAVSMPAGNCPQETHSARAAPSRAGDQRFRCPCPPLVVPRARPSSAPIYSHAKFRAAKLLTALWVHLLAPGHTARDPLVSWASTGTG